ncbi:peptidoglycan-binding protein [Streptomyces sp. NPDC018693]|uniref:peptidoglycan-binding domain-containing protein n=1 Tax=unclassified Streptomyces TaxID=2593676 RepID=UPI0037967A34
MTESKGWGHGRGQGHPCPECGALRALDNTPMCRCAERASDALRDTRTAEAAAAEDFDPLRIRPYVELGGPPAAPGEETMPLRAVDAGPQAPPPLPLPVPLAPPSGAPDVTDLRLFERPGAGEARLAAEEPRGRRRRRATALAAGGAALAVLAAAGFASGLFSYETPERDSAAPDGPRAAVPDQAADSPSASASAGGTASTSTSASSPLSPSRAPSPSPSPSTSASPSPSAPSASPSPSVPDGPSPSPSASSSPSPSTDAAAAGALPDTGRQSEGDTTVLRRGDKGAEVAELQARLQQLFLYNSDINGSYNEQVEDAVRNYQHARGVRGDELGEYGPPTRARLEAETREP